MPCYQVQTGEKLLHTEENNKVAMKSIILDQIQDLQREFGDHLQNLTKVCRVDRQDQCWLPDVDSKYLSMQESNLTKRLPKHFLALWHNWIKNQQFIGSRSQISVYLQALHRERTESMRWCVDDENENWAQGRVHDGQGKESQRSWEHDSSEPQELSTRQLCCPVLDLRRNQIIHKSHEGNKASFAPAGPLTCCQERKVLVVVSFKTESWRYNAAEHLIHMHKALDSTLRGKKY